MIDHMLVRVGVFTASAGHGGEHADDVQEPSISELFNDPSLAHYFEDGLVVPDMARLAADQPQQHHDHHGGATLVGYPVMNNQLLGVSNGNNSMSGGQIQQMVSSASTSDAGDGAAGKRKRSETSAGTGSAGKKPNGSCFGATFQIGNGLQPGSLGHHMLLHSNMGMN